MVPGIASVALLLLLVGRVPRLAANSCSPCLNGGTCEKSHTGKSFRCRCPNEGMTEYGLRCEILTRSFEIDSSYIWKYIWTKHDISGHSFKPEELAITFELTASCPGPLCDSLVIKGQGNNPLITFAHKLYSQAFTGTEDLWNKEFFLWSPAVTDHSDESLALKVSSPKVEYSKTAMSNERMLRDLLSVFVYLFKADSRTLTTYLQLCSLRKGSCLSGSLNQSYSGDLQASFKDAKFMVGKMNGCIRFIRVNGLLVDLGNIQSYEGNAVHLTKLTQPFCHSAEFSCLEFDGAAAVSTFKQNYCGKHSVCRAETSVRKNPTVRWCSCECTSAKRREQESDSNFDGCTNSVLPANECSLDTPVITTGPSHYEVKWTTFADQPITLGAEFFTIEGSIRTSEKQADKLLVFNNANAILPMNLGISGGFLNFCINSNCYTFPQLSVSDSEWHSFSVSIQNRKLTLMLDLQARDHLLASPASFTSYATAPVLSMRNSCVRGIRLSGVYLATGGSDVTINGANNFLKVLMGSGASAGHDCKLPELAQTGVINVCGCGKDEFCNTSVARPECQCSNGHERDRTGRCIVNSGPCNCGKDEVCITSTAKPECQCSQGYERDTLGRCIISIERIMAVLDNGERAKIGTASVLTVVALQLCALFLPSIICAPFCYH